MEPFIKGNDNNDQLHKIASIFGTENLLEYLEKFNINLDEPLEKLVGNYSPKDLKSFVNEQNKNLAKNDAIDLLQKMLVIDHVYIILSFLFKIMFLLD